MAKLDLYSYSIVGNSILPHYLDESDFPWLRRILEEHHRFVGRELRELRQRLLETTSARRVEAKRRRAVDVLLGMTHCKRSDGVTARKLRAQLFELGSVRPHRREDVVFRTASHLAIAPSAVDRALFSDLPDERPVLALDPPLEPSELAIRTNLALVQSLLFRASHVEVELDGRSRPVARFAKLQGLIVVVHRSHPTSIRLDISGPYALFRRTFLYGRALSGIVPQLAWADRFTMQAECLVDERPVRLEVSTGAPILPSREPKRFDSQVEERLARDLGRLEPDWEIIREGEPVETNGRLVFPDFLIRDRLDPSRRCVVEIVGFWTPEYLEKKLADLRQANLGSLVLCIDAQRALADGDLPDGAAIIRYKRFIDARAVKLAVESSMATSSE